jgi:hypothetical protein
MLVPVDFRDEVAERRHALGVGVALHVFTASDLRCDSVAY